MTRESAHGHTAQASPLPEELRSERALAATDPDSEMTGPPLDIVDQIVRALSTLGDRVSISSLTEHLTARQVLDRSSAIASALGAEAGPVAVVADHTPASVTAFLGILRSGRPAVLLDPLLPEERQRTLAQASGASTVISTPTTQEHARSLGIAVRHDAALIDHAPLSAPAPHYGQDVASIVYTSGSTGEPKGVALTYAAFGNGARLTRWRFDLTPEDRVALVLPMAFAAGQEVVAMALASGAELFCEDPRRGDARALPERLREKQITTIHLTPSLLRALTSAIPAGRPLESIRLFTTAGEPVHGRDIASARDVMPHARFVNYLGSSETGHLSFFHLAADDPIPEGTIPAGRPVPTKALTVVDENGTPLPAGETGQIVVTSPYLARGYWQRPEQTAERFVFASDGTIRYSAGDRGRLTSDGRLELAGRSDDAVKIRGYLVEPAEVEAVLRGADSILDAAVAATEGPRGAMLVAYAVPDPRRRTPSSTAIRAHLRAHLPEWMVPAHVLLLAELPRNERGKLDRRRLPAPPPRPPLEPAENEWERVIGEEWAAALELDAVSRSERFVALGGDSLAVEEMLQRVRDRLNVRMESADLASAATLAEFAALTRQRSGADAIGSTRSRTSRRRRTGTHLPFAAGSGGAPLYCFAGAGGTGLLFADLASRIDPAHPVHAFQVNGLENRGIPDWSIAATARRHLRTILADAPRDRPSVLVGHSLGGLFALEAGQQMIAHGLPQPHIVILDTVLPPAAAHAQGAETPEVRIPGGRVQTRSELWQTRFQLLGAGIIDYDTETTKKVFFQHGLRLTDRYRPERWNGPIDLLLTAENIDDRSWWSSIVSPEIVPLEFDCDHVSILKVPYVDRVAEVVIAALEKADTVRTT